MWAYGQASGARARGMRECACAGMGAGVCGSGQMGRRAGMHPCNILDGWRAHLQESDPNTYPKELDGCRANKPVRILQTFRNGRNGDPNAPRNPATNSLSIPTGE